MSYITRTKPFNRESQLGHIVLASLVISRVRVFGSEFITLSFNHRAGRNGPLFCLNPPPSHGGGLERATPGPVFLLHLHLNN